MRRTAVLAACALSLFAPRAGAQPPALPAALVAPASPALPQAQRQPGAAQSENFSSKVRLDKNGSVSVRNVSGDIVVTGGAGDDVSIEAVKRTSGDASLLSQVQIEVTQHDGRLDIGVHYHRETGLVSHQDVRVDFTIAVPRWAAVQAHSVSGGVRISGVDGRVRAESVSGDVSVATTPRLEVAKTVSGDVELSGATEAGDLTVMSVSGDVLAKNLKAASLDVQTVSGGITLADVACDRLKARSVSGRVEFSGSLAAGGRYDINTHSGRVRLTLASETGFELTASTYSGSIRSDLPLTLGGDRGDVRSGGVTNRAVHATFGNGSAGLTIRTFSGDIEIAKR